MSTPTLMSSPPATPLDRPLATGPYGAKATPPAGPAAYAGATADTGSTTRLGTRSASEAAADDGPPPLAPGTVIAPGYRVIAHLRRGNDLDVYDVWSEPRACRCVVKAMRPDRVTKRRAVQRLMTEGRLLQRLTHPHIVRGYETHRGPLPLIVLETLGGETLSHLINRQAQRLPIVAVAHLGLHLCSAMQYLHAEGIIHLDLKPSNIIAQAGIARVIDLSIAQKPGRCPAGVGSFGFLSPEQNDGGIVSAKTDVWGIGAVLFAAATGDAPFDHDETRTDLPQQVVPFQPLRRLRRVPAAFAAMIDQCLMLNPADRPDIPALTAALTAFVTPAGRSSGTPVAS